MNALVIICAYLAPSVVVGLWMFAPTRTPTPSRLISFAGLDE